MPSTRTLLSFAMVSCFVISSPMAVIIGISVTRSIFGSAVNEYIFVPFRVLLSLFDFLLIAWKELLKYHFVLVREQINPVHQRVECFCTLLPRPSLTGKKLETIVAPYFVAPSEKAVFSLFRKTQKQDSLHSKKLLNQFCPVSSNP